MKKSIFAALLMLAFSSCTIFYSCTKIGDQNPVPNAFSSAEKFQLIKSVIDGSIIGNRIDTLKVFAVLNPDKAEQYPWSPVILVNHATKTLLFTKNLQGKDRGYMAFSNNGYTDVFPKLGGTDVYSKGQTLKGGRIIVYTEDPHTHVMKSDTLSFELPFIMEDWQPTYSSVTQFGYSYENSTETKIFID